jgi:Flp pilus assembly protein TadG
VLVRAIGDRRRGILPSRHAAGAEDGSAAIEMAVSIPALLFVIVGLMKICLAVYSYHYVSEASREGARYAIVRGATCGTTFASACPASSDDISTYVKALTYPAINPSLMTVTTTWAGFPTGVACAPVVTPCNNPGNMVTITVQYSFPLSIPFRSTQTLNMTSTASGIIAQ